MSLDRFRKDTTIFPDSIARCRTSAIATYMGTRRLPAQPDESEAEWVVDCLFGGRFVFKKDPTYPGWYVVERKL
jgi:hypothetical protein